MWPSLDNPGMAKLLGNAGILGQGEACVWPSMETISGWLSYLGILGYLDKGGGACVWPSLDNPRMAKLLGNPGMLEQGGGHVCGHPWTVPGWLSYLGIP